ncbi:MAG: hypothetical protein RL757_811 [Bacteroidota bacterium]|jgi:dipeptidyl aminopeptidase/acylaminoacyl peptidase
MKKLFIGLALTMLSTQLSAQTGYQMPPKPLADLVLAPPTPTISVNAKGTLLLLIERSDLPTIAELSQPELRLAGTRINPQTNGGSRQAYVVNVKIKSLEGKMAEKSIMGIPLNARLSMPQWSPDETKIAFTNTTDDGIAVYILDLATATMKRLGNNLLVNGTAGGAMVWLPDSKSVLVKAIPANRGGAPAVTRVPTGPTIQENLGKKGQAPTYQDLLKNATDEKLFDYYFTSQLTRVSLDGKAQTIGEPSICTSISASPDGKYFLIESIKRPYSYVVPFRNFPTTVAILNSNDGKLVKNIAENPLLDNLSWSQDGTTPFPRNFSWRADANASVVWVEAQDGGDPKKEVAVRDKVFLSSAPTFDNKTEIYAAKLRFGGMTWGNDKMMFVEEYWWKSRKSITNMVNPSDWKTVVNLFDRSSEDTYTDPGQPETRRTSTGKFVLDINDKNELFFMGEGASAEGDRPFVDVLNLNTKKSVRIWQSAAPVFERPVAILDAEKKIVLTSRETPEENPNYYLRNWGKSDGDLQQITAFPHPNPATKGIQKQQIKYKRADGVELNAMLYLPAGYKKEQGPLPTFLWAYPAEFKSKDAAGQVSGSPYQFTRISYSGAPAMATMGYAVLNDAAIPIIGEGDKEPNDTYIEQLVAGAKAAIDEGVRMGVVDSSRVGVGGHSYGAFMTANLLTHSKLFKGGIARSGAYNRTLTPFGFQAEPRTYWQAMDIYNKMSPFMAADKMKTPLLLIHGEADNNTGTFPIQSERYYAALKGMGATVKLVMLPYEAHGYTAKESLLHMLYEMNGWLDKYVKNAKKE